MCNTSYMLLWGLIEADRLWLQCVHVSCAVFCLILVRHSAVLWPWPITHDGSLELKERESMEAANRWETGPHTYKSLFCPVCQCNHLSSSSAVLSSIPTWTHCYADLLIKSLSVIAVCVLVCLLQCFDLDKFEAMASESVLVERALKLLDQEKYWAGVVFTDLDSGSPSLVRYKIRMDVEETERTDKIKDRCVQRLSASRDKDILFVLLLSGNSHFRV